jgi:cytochrome P450
MAMTGHESVYDAGFNNFDYRVAGDVRDPYPELALARTNTPVLGAEGMTLDPNSPGAYVVFRHEDVTRVLRDNETFSSSVLKEVMGEVMGQKIILGMDEPEHRHHRSLVSTAFRQSTLARWEETTVRNVVNELIDTFADRGSAELVYEFTWPFPVQVVAEVLGLPRSDYKDFQRWAVAITTANAEWERGVNASKEMEAYLATVLEDRRKEPKDDLISELLHAELDGEQLDDEEIYSFLRLLLPAGAETTFRSSGNLLYLLFTHPEQLDAVRNDRSLLPQAIEEALRFEPPLLITTRVVTKDTEIGGTKIAAGSSVTPMLGAANRDPAQYADPDTFNIFRDPKQHVSFGTGPHMCLGMHLARMETRVALNALFDRLPNLRLDEDAAARDDVHIHGQIFRSPTSLPVVWGD